MQELKIREFRLNEEEENAVKTTFDLLLDIQDKLRQDNNRIFFNKSKT